MSLKVWLPLNGDLRNQGSSNVEVTNNGAVVNSAGKIGSCYSFGTSSSYMTLPPETMTGFGTECSVSFWIKILSWNTSYATYFQAGKGGTAWSNYIFGFLRNSSGSTICFTISNGSSASNNSYLTSAMELNKWYHVALIYKTGICQIYLNGALDHEYTTTIVPKFSDISKITIGTCNTTSSYQTNCLLNDFRIYDHALSIAEVREIARGLVLHYKLNQPNINIVNGVLIGRPIKNSRGNDYTNGEWDNLSGGNGSISVIKDNTAYIGNCIYRISNNTSGNKDIAQYSANAPFTLISGQKYTMSAYYRGQCTTLMRVWNATGGAQLISGTSSINTGTEWQRVTNTFTATSAMTGSNDIGFLFGLNGSSNGNVDICGMKVEIGETATEWYPSALEIDTTIITDSSGYNHNGSITGNIISDSSTARYNYNLKLNDSASSIGIGNLSTMLPDGGFTFNIWFKKITDEWSSKAYETILGGPSGFELEAKVSSTNSPVIKCYNWGGGTIAYTLDEWHMLTMIRNSSETKFYLDGELKVTGTAGSIPSGDYFIGAWKTATQQNYRGHLSDVRIYATQLLDNDIKMLYNTTMRIDPQKNIHNFEINENAPYNKLTPTGMLEDNMVESCLTLKDGSKWKLMLFHYVDGGNNLFTSSNATYCNDWGLYSRLSQITNYQYDGKYEYYVIQDGVEYRWTQTSSPTASSISGLATVSGYTNPVNGLAKASQNNTYIGYGSWWGACGCWTSYTLSGKKGIPGFGPHSADGICTKYLILYTRVSDFGGTFEDGTAFSNNFIEM